MFDKPQLRLNARIVRLGACGVALVAVFATSGVAAAQGRRPMTPEEEREKGIVDPRRRPLPRTHRARLGLQLDYVRLSAAFDEDTGETQRFHWLPMQLDLAYQAQFLKYAMIRPSFAFGVNIANSIEAMPIVVHPALHFGYQGPPVRRGVRLRVLHAADPEQGCTQRDPRRARPADHHEQPSHRSRAVLHHSDPPKSRAAPGAGELSFQLRVGGVNSRTQHFDLDRRRWRMMVTFNIGWYFGDGRAAKRRRQRRAQQDAAGA